MSLASLKPEHLKRYKDIAGLLIRHGRADLLDRGGLDQAFIDEQTRRAADDGRPEQLAADLEALGPTFVKLGQVLSTRADLLPQPYLDALARLHDRVEPFEFEQVREIIREELGLEVSSAFAEFDRRPIASASLGQVHRAQLEDGRVVAVKVQRPGIRLQILGDLAAFDEIAGLVDRHTDVGRRYAFSDMLDELRAALLRELDYRREARNLERMAGQLSGRRRLFVPRPVERLTASRVLTMDFVRGVRVTELSAADRTGLDGGELATELCEAYLEQILLEGFFHADPHPGNVLITEDGRLALIDLGMVARLAPDVRERLLQLVLALTEGDSTEAARLCIDLGTPLDDCDEPAFARRIKQLVTQVRDAKIEELQLGRVVIELAQISASHGIRPAPELTIVGKTLLHLDEVGRALDPGFDPNAVIRGRMSSIIARQMLRGVGPGRLFSALLEANAFVRQLPGRVNRLLDALARREFEVRVNAFDERRMMNSLQQIGTRITLGLILASLVVGASLIMNIETRSTLFGYPALAIVLFLIAVFGGLALAASIFIQDIWRRRR